MGNVRASIAKTIVNNEVEADVLTWQHYYPYGQIMPNRNYNAGNYRYGFNGKESDDEVSGVGNQYDYGFRIYNPRLGRFLTIDPLFRSYPWFTPYQFAANGPIWATDLDGLEANLAIFSKGFERPAFESRAINLAPQRLLHYEKKDPQFVHDPKENNIFMGVGFGYYAN